MCILLLKILSIVHIRQINHFFQPYTPLTKINIPPVYFVGNRPRKQNKKLIKEAPFVCKKPLFDTVYIILVFFNHFDFLIFLGYWFWHTTINGCIYLFFANPIIVVYDDIIITFLNSYKSFYCVLFKKIKDTFNVIKAVYFSFCNLYA